MKAMPLFDATESETQRDKGMELAAEKRKDLLFLAVLTARNIARRTGQVCADDVQEYMEFNGNSLGNAAGSIFRGKEWECIGWKKSERVSNHARSIRIWRLKG